MKLKTRTLYVTSHKALVLNALHQNYKTSPSKSKQQADNDWKLGKSSCREHCIYGVELNGNLSSNH